MNSFLKKLVIKLAAFSFSFLFCSTSLATTYYISPKGNDNSGNGSISTPWQSLYKATSNVSGIGDIIHVAAGEYVERQQCKLAIGVSIEGEGTVSVIKSTLTADWTEILSLRSPEGTNGEQHISNLKFDGQNLSTFWCIWITGRSNVSIFNCTIINFKDRGVTFDGRNDNSPAPPAIFATGNNFHDNIVTNCAAYNTDNGIYGRGCLNIGGQEDMLIYNNTITQNSRPEGFNGWPIKYSNDGYLKGIKIYNNILTKIPYSGNFGGDNGWDFAIEFWNILGGMEIYKNTIQGGCDLVNTIKNKYPYGVWFHDNKLSQQKLNSHFESGIIFEISQESLIVENNVFDKISGGILFNAQEHTVLSNIVIRKNVFSDIGKKTGNDNNGSGINLNCGTLFGNNFHYSVNNLAIYDNSIVAADNNAPFFGIEITGAGSVGNISIHHNTIKNFRIACIIANPANVIDGLTIENNILSGNGTNNDPFFIGGSPANYTIKNNTKSGPAPPFNIKQQIIRPFYYDIKRATMLEFLAAFTAILSLLLCSKENIYVYPVWLVGTVIYIFLNFEPFLVGEIMIQLYYLLMCVYGWVLWSKRDRRKHRIIRVSASTKKEIFIQLAIFASCFILIFFALQLLKNNFIASIIPWADAFAMAAAFTAMWLMVNKKAESWYWWIAANAVSIPLYYAKHLVFTSSIYGLLLVMSIWGLFQWKKRKMSKRRNTTA